MDFLSGSFASSTSVHFCGTCLWQPGWPESFKKASLTCLAADAGSWLGHSVATPCVFSSPSRLDRLSYMIVSGSSPREWNLKLGHICHVLLVKATHKVNSDSVGKEIEEPSYCKVRGFVPAGKCAVYWWGIQGDFPSLFSPYIVPVWTTEWGMLLISFLCGLSEVKETWQIHMGLMITTPGARRFLIIHSFQDPLRLQSHI